jgi:serpin B
MALSVPPRIPVFRADHPFLFAIRDQESGAIVFLGRIANPTLVS